MLHKSNFSIETAVANCSGAMETDTISKNGRSIVNKIKHAILFCVFICISVGSWGQTTSATIKKIWVEYDVYQDGEKGMDIHVNFSVSGMLHKQGTCNVWFYYSDETKLKDKNDKYATTAGTVSTWEDYKPGYASCTCCTHWRRL